MNRTEIRASLALAAVYVLRMLGLFMVMPVLAILAVKYPDYSALMLGLAIGGYGLTQAILQIPMGVLSDKIGRKPVIVGGLLMFAIGSGVAATADSMLWIVIGRFLQGAGAIAGAIMALAGDVSREQQRPKVMAIIGIAIGFSFYIALLIGPVIADNYGLHGIFSITGILAILCIPLVIWVVPSAINYAPKGDTLPVLTDVKTLFFDPQLRRLNISVMLLHMMITVLFVQMPILLSALGWELDRHWQLYLPILAASVVGLVILMMLTRTMSQSAVIRLCILLLGAALLGLHFEHGTVLAVMGFGWLFFAGFNFLEASFPAMVSSIAPAGKKGSAMGIYASFQFLGAFLGGTLSGLASQYIGPQWVFVIAGGACGLWWLGLRKLGTSERLKRYTLKPDFTRYSAQTIGEQLATLEGVVDVTVVPDEGVVYIKAHGKQFEIDKAHVLVNG
ncbi:MAG: MFS transporter [Paraglaciecola sp.]|uniref:Inner membrane transport protein yajR n=1 Tax=Paraglaciecola agarilytica NO2 TaxID=1125747 RepID=A0ABQ0I708_9ALTE|nr:MFS transporter [Paraglaciecola agarilytica]GAC05133.1 inner membrane transport protein yajR [Paraglaciecola agarilytica NO2]